jgi:hypothetical protein
VSERAREVSDGVEGGVKWTPPVGPKAGRRKRDACSDFVTIKNTS